MNIRASAFESSRVSTQLRVPAWLAIAGAIVLAAISGAMIPGTGWVVVLIVAGLAVLTVYASVGSTTQQLFLASLAVLLMGFLFYSRAFSYIGVPPIFISELVLVLGLLGLVFTAVDRRITGLHVLLLGFIVLGMARTIPYFGQYGLDSLRDAATWYYALFAIVVSLSLAQTRLLAFLHIYATMLSFLILWLAVMSTTFRFLPPSIAELGRPVLPIFYTMKAGDRAVILTGLAAFVVTGLYARIPIGRHLNTVVFWWLWSITALMIAVTNRGGMMALAAAFAVVGLVRPSTRLFQAAFVGLVMFTALLLVNPTIDLGGARTVSVDQLRTNVLSIFSDETQNIGSVQSTKDWRLDWWDAIIKNTLNGPQFLSGQGFGINLADEYGFQTDLINHSLRSPHSIHMTILARMGVPGLVLWLGINIALVVRLLQTHHRARRQGQALYADVSVWLLAIWAATLVNGSFDVYLESPYGAIPFWCVVGAGIALPRLQREDAARANPASA